MTQPNTAARRTARRIEGWRPVAHRKPPEFDPVEVAAATVVRWLLRASPELAEAVTAPGSVTVLALPAAEWVTPFQRAWVAELHPPEEAKAGHADDPENEADYAPVDPPWFGFSRDGATRERDSAELRSRVLMALHSGRPVYGWSHNPEELLPAQVLRLADRVVVVPPLEPDVLAEALAVLTGQPPKAPIPKALACATGLHDIAAAWREGETADGVLARLERLVGSEAQSPPEGRLETLLGMDPARDWGLGVKRDLPAYRAGRLGWSDIDHAVLLTGPPGCGKTTFARRMAGSCGLPLVTGSPQVWQGSKDGHLGHALAAMQATFRQARATAPCVLFLDEIDSMGSRATYTDTHRDYSTAYMNGLLEQLDGVADLEGVIVIAACNHADRLDPALVRAGRLDRTLRIGFPDEAALTGMLRQRLGGDLPDADLLHVARLAHRATGADCEKWVRGARRRARHAGRPVTLDDLIAEVSPPGDALSAEMRRRAAVHEAGHVVVAILDRPGSVVRVSIRQGPVSGGFTEGTSDEPLLTRSALERNLRRMLGGRAAEELLLGDASSGAGGAEESDLAKATMLAATAVMALGLGTGRDGQPLIWRGEPSAATLRSAFADQPGLAKEVGSMLAAAHHQAREMLEANRAKLTRVARALLDQERLEGSDVDLLVAPAEVHDGGGHPAKPVRR